MQHGINTYKSDTQYLTSRTAVYGIPFYVGSWPCHKAEGFKGVPQIAHSFAEAEKAGGYSDDWRDSSGNPKWSLCQAMYSQFKLFGTGPAIFYNVFDPSTHKTAVTAATMAVTNHIVKLPSDALINASLSVKNGSTDLAKDTDYEAYYDGDYLIVELLSTGSAYSASSLTIGYDKANPGAITASDISAAIEKIELCMSTIGIVPDLICCPGWSQTPTVAAVMCTKAASINSLFKAKAVVDLDTASGNADEYADVVTYKNANSYTDENEIVCWPLVKVGSYLFDYSVIIACEIASVDAENGGVPYESPSNKEIPITACVNKAGTEINLTVQQADAISCSGVVTAFNFNGWVVWGNYTGCYPSDIDIAKKFICTNRMMDYLCNYFAKTYWSYLDRPLTRVRIDAIINSFNTYLDGLTHDGMLYGGKIEYVPDNNPLSDLIAGKFCLNARMASPVPMQQINMYLEYDVELLNESING